MRMILKSLVGSRAHGLARPDSDFDWRGVFVLPTDEILWAHAKDSKTKTISWIEGDQDDTSYEVGHFLKLAMVSNPSVLELLASNEMPIKDEWGQRLIDLLPHLWSTKGVYNAFGGYAHNNIKKFFDGKDGRPLKYAVASIRVSLMGKQLLETGRLTMKVADISSAWVETLTDIRDNYYTPGVVYNFILKAKAELQAALDAAPEKHTDEEKVKQFLLDIRRDH